MTSPVPQQWRFQCALVVPWHYFCAEHTQSITKSFISPRQGSIARTSSRNPSRGCGWLLKHSTIHLLHNPILQLPRKLWQNYPAKWLFQWWKSQPPLKIAAILNFRSRKIKIQILHSQRYMIWHQYRWNRKIIWGFIQKCIFWVSKWRTSWNMAAILIFWSAKIFFSISSPQVVVMPILMLVSWFERFPRKKHL